MPHRDVARTGQICGNRLDGFKNDQRHSKQGQGRIRAQRNYPDTKTSEYSLRGNPIGEWSGNSLEHCIHQEVDGRRHEYYGFQNSVHVESPDNHP
jgi:hypothetical protein